MHLKYYMVAYDITNSNNGCMHIAAMALSTLDAAKVVRVFSLLSTICRTIISVAIKFYGF